MHPHSLSPDTSVLQLRGLKCELVFRSRKRVPNRTQFVPIGIAHFGVSALHLSFWIFRKDDGQTPINHQGKGVQCDGQNGWKIRRTFPSANQCGNGESMDLDCPLWTWMNKSWTNSADVTLLAAATKMEETYLIVVKSDVELPVKTTSRWTGLTGLGIGYDQ